MNSLGVVAGPYEPDTKCERCGTMLVLIDTSKVLLSFTTYGPPVQAWYELTERVFGVNTLVEHLAERCDERRAMLASTTEEDRVWLREHGWNGR